MTILSKNTCNLLVYKKNIRKNWYIFHTYPRAEFIAEDLLKKKGFEVFLPQITTLRVWKNRQKKLIKSPLISGYIFVFIAENKTVNILRNPKIITCVKNDKQKLTLNDKDIQRLQKIISTRGKLEITNNYKVGDKVRFTSGPFLGLEGNIICTKGKNRFGIDLEALNHAIVLDTDLNQDRIEKI